MRYRHRRMPGAQWTESEEPDAARDTQETNMSKFNSIAVALACITAPVVLIVMETASRYHP